MASINDCLCWHNNCPFSYVSQHVFLATYRSVLRNPKAAFSNLLALSIGVASVLFVANLVFYELSYDHQMDAVFRVETISQTNAADAFTPFSLGQKLRDQIDEVEGFGRLIPYSEYKSAAMTYVTDSSENPAYFKRAYYADPEVLDFFDVNLLIGKVVDFQLEDAMLISQKSAITLFGKDWRSQSIGALFKQGRGAVQQSYQIVGVFADRDPSTHIHFDALVSAASLDLGTTSVKGYTYVTGNLDSFAPTDTLNIRPAAEIHLAQGVSNEAESVANLELLLLLAGVGSIVLLITVMNYVNSTIIHFVDRCKALGIRKLHGASSRNLAMRLWSELLLINLIAACLGLGLFLLSVDMVNRHHLMTYPRLDQILWTKLFFLLSLIWVFTTLLSVAYPIYFLSRIEVIAALKGAGSLLRTKAFSQAGRVASSFLVIQIASSFFFLSASWIIHRQLKLIETHPKGEVHVTGVFPGMSGANQRFTDISVGFLEEMISFGTIASYSFSNMRDGRIKTEQRVMLEDSSIMYLSVVDPSFWNESNTLIQGGHFAPSFGQNAGQVVLNSSLAKSQHGYNDTSATWTLNGYQYETIGIFDADEQEVSRALVSGFRYLTYIDLVLDYQARGGDRLDQFLEKAEHMISTRFPFFSLIIREQRTTGKLEKQVLTLFVVFGGISVLVSVIGLFSLSTFVTRKKSMEVGVRKILGASSLQILIGLLRDFAKLVLLAGLITTPVTYLVGNHWLENYTERTSLGLLVFLLPLLLILTVAMLAVLNKSWQAATLNPIAILDEGK